MIGSLALTAFAIGYHHYDIPAYLHSLVNQGYTGTVVNSITPLVGRTMAFSVLSLSQLFHSFNMRSEHSLSEVGVFGNRKLVLSFIICGLMQVAVISLKPLSDIFQVVNLNSIQWAYVFLLSFVPIVVVELQKMFNRRGKK
jgi:Ca2+-transporting ATPase